MVRLHRPTLATPPGHRRTPRLLSPWQRPTPERSYPASHPALSRPPVVSPSVAHIRTHTFATFPSLSPLASSLSLSRSLYLSIYISLSLEHADSLPRSRPLAPLAHAVSASEASVSRVVAHHQHKYSRVYRTNSLLISASFAFFLHHPRLPNLIRMPR